MSLFFSARNFDKGVVCHTRQRPLPKEPCGVAIHLILGYSRGRVEGTRFLVCQARWTNDPRSQGSRHRNIFGSEFQFSYSVSVVADRWRSGIESNSCYPCISVRSGWFFEATFTPHRTNFRGSVENSCVLVLRSHPTTLNVREFRRLAVQSSMWTERKYWPSSVNGVCGQFF